MRLFLQKMYRTFTKNFAKSDKVSAMKNESTDVISFIIMKILNLTNRFKINALAILALMIVFGANEVKGQTIAPAGSYLQNFDAIGTTASASLPTGWVAQNITGARNITAAYSAVTGTATTLSNAYNVAMGTTAANGIYNFGNATASDRSVGGLSSGSSSQSVNMFLKLTNSSTTTSIPSFSISYKAKRFRNGSNTAGFSIRLYYSTTGAASSWTEIPAGALSFTANADNTGSTTNPLETKTASNIVLAQSLAASGTIYFAWSYSVTSGTTTSNAQALGIDDITIAAVSSSPTITGAATAAAFTTTYGTASIAQTFLVSGTNLSTALVATAPTGYEVSADGTTYGATATFTQTGGSASGSLLVRLAASANVTGNNYNAQTIGLTSTGATTVNITTASSGNTVNAKALTISGINAINKVYDGILTAAFNGTATYSGLVNSETFDSVLGTPSANFLSKTAGTAKSVIVTGYMSPSSNYTISQPIGLTADITAAPLTITEAAVTSKSYDGSTTASITGTLNGILGSDMVTFASGTSSFASANPGSGIAVTAGCTLTGTDANNYILTQPTGLTGTINAIVSPTISLIPATPEAFTTTYGTASASQSFTVIGSSLSNNITVNAATGFEVATDNSTFGSSVTFTQSSGSISSTVYVRLAATNSVAISHNSVTAATFTSTGASTVTLTTPSAGNSVAAKALTISGITAVNKVYDGLLTAVFNGIASYAGLVNGDSFMVTGTPSASFATKNAGTGKSVTISGYTAPSSNYIVSQPTDLTADITAATLIIENAVVTSKTYNGTTLATITGALTGVVSGDVVTFDSGTSAFINADAGSGIAVNSGCLLSGTDSSNYILIQPTGLIGTINLANQTITGLAATATKSLSDVSYALTATASSGLTVTYTSSNTAVATISGAMVTIVGAGTTTITASEVGNSNYNAATPLTQLLTVATLPSVLAAGDVAVVAVNSGTPDSFAVVLLKAINAGTVINFTDCGLSAPDASGRTGEGFLTFTAPTALPFGTVLTWTNGMAVTGTGWSSAAPTSFAFAGAGDQLFVFQGNTANWGNQSGITLLFGVNYGVSLVASSTITSNTTYQPSATALPTTAFLNLSTSTNANGYYSGNGLTSIAVTLCGSPATILANVVTPAKWKGTLSTIATFPAYTVTSVCPPTVVATGALTAFTSTYGTASAAQTVSVSALSLTTDMIATAPAGFEVSYNGTSWGSTATFAQTDGIASGTLSIRLAANAAVSGIYNSNTIVLSSTGAASVNITTTSTGNTVSPLGISIIGVTGDSKIYDGTTSATLAGNATYSGLVNGDTFTSVFGTPIAVFSDKNVDTGKTITISGYTAPSTNYTVTQPTASADITAKEVTLSAIVAHDKVYDGDYPTTVSATINGVVTPDNVTLVSSALFTGGPYIGNFGVTATFALNGTDATNYTLVQPDTTSLTATITPKPLTISNPIASNKEYDGTTAATISGTLVGVVTSTAEVVTLNGSYGTFATSGVGTNIVVIPTWVMDGDIYNYTLVQPTNILTANITSPGSPSITSTLVASANYGVASTSYSISTDISATSYSASGLPDGLSINTTTGEITGAPTTAGTFNVTLGATGTGGTGYATLVYTISPITLTVSGAIANEKAYDGTTSATINGTLVGVINSDDVTFNGVGTFDSFNVASNISVTSNSSLTGSQATNYILENPIGLVANITPKALIFTASVADKVYDRTNIASVTITSINGVVGSDEVTATMSGAFDTVIAGNDKPVIITSILLGGANAANYSVVTPTTVTGNITQKPITVTATANNKVFDGTDVATITVSAKVGVISPDVVTVTGGGTFVSTSIATNISVTPSLVLDGADANNYTLTQPTGLTANILVVPTILEAGDIAVIGYNSNSSPDNFAILVLKDLISGTQFFVNDNEVATAGGTTFTDLNEGEASFTVKFGQTIPAGTVITLPWGGAAVSTATYDWSSTTGAGLGNANDEIYIYSAPSITATTPTQFIYFAKIGSSSSSIPSGLTAAYTSNSPSSSASRYSTTGNIYNSCKSILLTEIGKTATSNWNTIGATTIAPTDWTFTVMPTCPTPTISVSGIVTGLTTVYGSASETTASFSLNGSYLTNSITITAPTGFEVSSNATSDFANSITVNPSSGSLASTIIYVRLSATATVINSPYSGDIVCSSAGATSVNVATDSSTVTPKPITITGILIGNKVEDGTTTGNIIGTPVLNGVLISDTANVTLVTSGATAQFTQSNAGTGIGVIIAGYALNGSASANYSLTQPTGLTGTITSVASPAISSALNYSSIYGTVASSYIITALTDASYPITGYNATDLPTGLSVDTVTGEISGTPTATPGIYTVTISATNVGGTTNAYLIYSITPKELTVSGATASSKVYNATTAATILGYSLNGIYGSDVVTASGTGLFSDKNVGTGVSVTATMTLSGADASKYILIQPTGLTADITPLTLTLSGVSAQNKVVDGTNVAIINATLVGVISGDLVTFNGTGTFESSNVGQGIAVTSTATLSGADAGNYTFVQPTGLIANITDKVLYYNSFTGASACPSNGNVPTMAANSIGTPVTRSTVTCNATANVFNSTTISTTASLNPVSYIEFSVSSATGYQLNLKSLSFFRQASNSAPNKMEVRYSTDGFITYNTWGSAPTTPTSGTVATWDFADFSTTLSNTVTFRIYPYGTLRADNTPSATTGTFRVDNVTVYGTVSSVTPNTANLKLNIEGYYNATTQSMVPVKANQLVAGATN
ncbi:beta strand repeat-containing protein, partial [Flavobacterium sp.]|uniref:beta strand repeat-containing protein n=1 Tax=Flavobacterium sp. TaxID=239 RepID=UPI003BC028FB